MIALIFKTINRNRRTILIYLIISLLFLLMYTSLFPSIQKDADKMAELFNSYPEAMRKAFNINDNLFSVFENYLGAEHYSLLWPIMVILLAVTNGAGAIAGEIEKRTIELLLSLPLSRTKVFFAKYISGFILITTFVVLSVLSIVPVGILFGVDINIGANIAVMIIGLLFSIAIYSITFMFSSIFSSRGMVASLAGGIMIIMYALNIFASLQESVKSVRYLSFFYYYDYSKALSDSQIGLSSTIVFLSTIAITTAIGWYVFRKRDLSV